MQKRESNWFERICSMLVKLMHTISSALHDPVIVLLIALTVLVVALLGMLIAEFFTERRYFKLSLPVLIDNLSTTEDPEAAISESALLWRQKKRLLELLKLMNIRNQTYKAILKTVFDVFRGNRFCETFFYKGKISLVNPD